MPSNVEKWERRPVFAAVTGPELAGLGWIRRQFARHKHIACPESPSRFWDTTYRVFPDARPEHWHQAFTGLTGPKRVEVDASIAMLPSWKIGALTAANPSIRVLYVLRDPVELSWQSIRAFHTAHDATLGLGPGTGWIEDVLASPDEYRGVPIGLIRQADYAKHVATLFHHLHDSRVSFVLHRDLVADPELGMATILSGFLKVPPHDDAIDEPMLDPESAIADEPPPSVRERLSAIHRRQVQAIEAMTGETISGRSE